MEGKKNLNDGSHVEAFYRNKEGLPFQVRLLIHRACHLYNPHALLRSLAEVNPPQHAQRKAVQNKGLGRAAGPSCTLLQV